MRLRIGRKFGEQLIHPTCAFFQRLWQCCGYFRRTIDRGDARIGAMLSSRPFIQLINQWRQLPRAIFHQQTLMVQGLKLNHRERVRIGQMHHVFGRAEFRNEGIITRSADGVDASLRPNGQHVAQKKMPHQRVRIRPPEKAVCIRVVAQCLVDGAGLHNGVQMGEAQLHQRARGER